MMKKPSKSTWKLIATCLVFILAILGAVLVFTRSAEPQKVTLSQEYLNGYNMGVIDIEGYQALVDDQKSFVVISYIPGCSAQILTYLKHYAIDHNLAYFYLPWSATRELDLKSSVKFPPTVMIFNQGKLTAFLDSNSNIDAKYYNSEDEFSSWMNFHLNI